MAKKVITKKMPGTGGYVQLSCGNNYAQFSTELNRVAFDEILDGILKLEFERGKLAERNLHGYKGAIEEIDALSWHIRANYLYRFV